MKKTIALLTVTLALLHSAVAQSPAEAATPLLDQDIDRSDILYQRLDVYRIIPSNLWNWNYGSISTIAFDGFYRAGDFKTVDDFSEEYGMVIETESVQKMTDKNWMFYGKFSFKNSVHNETSFNMSFSKSEVGSPFRVVIERMGDFRSKSYGLVGGLSKKLNEKWALGGQLDYAGDLHFRTRDTRNEQYNLTIDASASVSYNFNPHRSLSLGVAYYYKKTTNEYSNAFKTSGTEYDLYTLNGLGDFNAAELSDNIIITDKNPKFLVSYFSGKKNALNLVFSFYPGKEEWKNKITTLTSLSDEKYYKYEYLKNTFTGSYRVANSNFELYNKLRANFILGDGYEYRANAYQHTYLYEGLTANYSTTLNRKAKNIAYKNILGIAIETIRKKDMSYAHEMNYTNLNARLQTGYFLPLNSKNKLAIDIRASYKLNLDYLHETAAAASKPYTINLAYNEMAFYTADYVRAGIDASWYARIGKLRAEYKIQYSYTKPIDIKIDNAYSLLSTDTYKNTISAKVNFYF